MGKKKKKECGAAFECFGMFRSVSLAATVGDDCRLQAPTFGAMY